MLLKLSLFPFTFELSTKKFKVHHLLFLSHVIIPLHSTDLMDCRFTPGS